MLTSRFALVVFEHSCAPYVLKRFAEVLNINYH